MCEPARDEKLALVLLAQLHHHVLAERRTRLADVHSHIEHLSLDHTHKLRLRGVALLIVQTTQHTERRLRLIVLDEHRPSNMLVELSLLPGLHEIPTGILKHLGLDDENTLDFGLNIFHNLEILCKGSVKI